MPLTSLLKLQKVGLVKSTMKNESEICRDLTDQNHSMTTASASSLVPNSMLRSVACLLSLSLLSVTIMGYQNIVVVGGGVQG
jgi:hypothetical protein